eukprot:2361142-Rhodomonas_salina.3
MAPSGSHVGADSEGSREGGRVAWVTWGRGRREGRDSESERKGEGRKGEERRGGRAGEGETEGRERSGENVKGA